MNELLQALTPALLSIAMTLAGFIAAYLGLKAKNILANMETEQNNTQIREIVESTVCYVEQIGKLLGSEEKLAEAKKVALEWMNSKGLKVSEVELNTLIESTVQQYFAKYEK